jgi:hypothetical protein
MARCRKTWDTNKKQRLKWSKEGRPRDYRFINHYAPWAARFATSKPPPEYAHIAMIKEIDKKYEEKKQRAAEGQSLVAL